MCEYCGCQALVTIEELTREHDAALDLMRDAHATIASGDLDATRRLCGQLLRLLAPHNKVEEQGLFAALWQEYPEHVDVLLAEHAAVHAAFLDMEDGSPRSDWPDRLSEALHTLREHIAKEQDGLFPAALSTLSTSQWETAERVRREVGSALLDRRSASAEGPGACPAPRPSSGADVTGTGTRR